MTDAFGATIEDLAAQYNEQIRHVREMYGRRNELASEAWSPDGLVGVTVGPHGQVRAIELNPRVYRKLSPSELAQSIMEQIGRATAVVSQQAKELMEPFMPADLPYEEIFGENVNLDAFLPQPVELREGSDRPE
ncbi:YbaB/EbfC family nucleoid-associated protein [Microtetraspora sp. NBRC 16547]|uniref:YbaB/EbfC family nucleoid-associated protein n=1 Tax=Microtetraspora sp. NBRC 16547 TaxID=3030993 RepID=UPI0024A18B17|nr:YbaB/EbfC family nucleoid-associated protein [Microtetraspora sp. NBRC 16547]GLX00104.1 hypothetical protein Misp02_41900 [Microtetraspora sp. NBRC 16547]